jgi:hypothetical protein
MSKDEDRLHRQFEAIERTVPAGRRFVRALRRNRYRYLRIPLALVLILGGFAWFLPVLGFWMLPAGLLLLAIDIPALRPSISAAVILVRRRTQIWWRSIRDRWRG